MGNKGLWQPFYLGILWYNIAILKSTGSTADECLLLVVSTATKSNGGSYTGGNKAGELRSLLGAWQQASQLVLQVAMDVVDQYSRSARSITMVNQHSRLTLHTSLRYQSQVGLLRRRRCLALRFLFLSSITLFRGSNIHMSDRTAIIQ